MLLNCGVGEDSWESLGCKEIKPVNPKGNQPQIFIERTSAKAPILWPPDAKNWLIGKDLMLRKTEGRRRGDDSRWDGWMASPTRWTWVWASSGNCWRTGKPGMLQSIELQRVGHDWATELNWLLNHWKWGPCVLWEKVKEVKFGACNNSKLGYTVWDLPLFSLLPLVVDQKILSAGKCVIAIYYIQLFKYQLNTSQKPALVKCNNYNGKTLS